MKKKEKNKDYFYESFWKAFDVIQIKLTLSNWMLNFFSMCDFHKKTRNIEYRYNSPSKFIVKAKRH